jgi:NAD(P)H-dependent flavin oxidoreductase YrpB (nitropropane dioxygenase family)
MASGWRGILGFEYGIVQAPLGPDISGPELAAAVANAGGIGLVRLPDWVPIPSTTTLSDYLDFPISTANVQTFLCYRV